MKIGEIWYQCYTQENTVFGFAVLDGIVTSHHDKSVLGLDLQSYKKILIYWKIKVSLIAKIEPA